MPVVTVKTSGGCVVEGKAVADDGAGGCEMCVIGLFDGEGINRGVLKVFQYCCSGVNLVEGVEGSLTCWRGRTGAAIATAVLCFNCSNNKRGVLRTV